MKVIGVRISMIANMIGIFAVFFLLFSKLFNYLEVPTENLLALIAIVGVLTALNYIMLFKKTDTD